MIGHHARFRENDDLPLWRGPAAKNKPPFFNARALITRKIMRSKLIQKKVELWFKFSNFVVRLFFCRAFCFDFQKSPYTQTKAAKTISEKK